MIAWLVVALLYLLGMICQDLLVMVTAELVATPRDTRGDRIAFVLMRVGFALLWPLAMAGHLLQIASPFRKKTNGEDE